MRAVLDLTVRLAEAILLDIAEQNSGWQGWPWWFSGASDELFAVAENMSVRVIERYSNAGDSSYGISQNDDGDKYIVFAFTSTSQFDGDTRYFTKRCVASSYSGDDWSNGEFKEARVKTRTIVTFE